MNKDHGSCKLLTFNDCLCFFFFIASYPDSVFDVVLCGIISPAVIHDDSLLAEVLRILKLQGRLLLIEPLENNPKDNVMSRLKLNGYLDCEQVIKDITYVLNLYVKLCKVFLLMF